MGDIKLNTAELGERICILISGGKKSIRIPKRTIITDPRTITEKIMLGAPIIMYTNIKVIIKLIMFV